MNGFSPHYFEYLSTRTTLLLQPLSFLHLDTACFSEPETPLISFFCIKIQHIVHPQ